MSKRTLRRKATRPMTPNLGLSSSTLRADAIAGLTAAAVVLPKAMAYATVAGLSVSVGLYTAFVPLIVYALIGTSRVLSVSSTTTLAILTGAQLGLAVPDGDPVKLTVAAATLTALTGVLLIGASVLRLGFLANFISTPVLTGFKAGIGLVIVLDQVPKLVGIHITKRGFFHDIASLAQHVPEASLITVAVAAAALVALLVAERLKPHSSAPLFVVAAGIAASWFFSLPASGVATVGTIPQALPALTLPSFALVGQLLPGALGIALMSFTETIAAGRAFAAPADPPDHRQPGAGGDRRREPEWRLVRGDAGRRRDLADRRGPRGRRADADRLAGHRRSGSRDHAGVCAVSRAAAAGGAGGRGHRVLGGPDQSRRVHRDPQDTDAGIHLGDRRLCRRPDLRHAAGHHGGDRAVADRAVQPGGQFEGLCDRPQAGGRRAAAAFARKSRRRYLRGVADPATRGAVVLCQCAAGWRPDPRARCRAQPQRGGAGPEPRSRHRILGPADAGGRGATLHRGGGHGLAGGGEPQRAGVHPRLAAGGAGPGAAAVQRPRGHHEVSGPGCV